MNKRTPPRRGRNSRRIEPDSIVNHTEPIIESESQPEFTGGSSNLVDGLSWVEFHRLANRVFDALDPHIGKGHLYTFEEVERSCEARSILAKELASLLGKNTITDLAIEANRASRGRVLKFNRNRNGRGKGKGKD